MRKNLHTVSFPSGREGAAAAAELSEAARDRAVAVWTEYSPSKIDVIMEKSPDAARK